eukprot:178879-Prorocentrum_minimum.AAC.1
MRIQYCRRCTAWSWGRRSCRAARCSSPAKPKCARWRAARAGSFSRATATASSRCGSGDETSHEDERSWSARPLLENSARYVM